MLRERIYFAHPISLYNHPLENLILTKIRHTYGRGGEDPIIVNPNSPLFQSRYEGKTFEDSSAIGFGYWLGIADTCDSCVFTSFSNSLIGSGVAKEVQTFFNRCPKGAIVREYSYINRYFIIHTNFEAIKSRILSHDSTRLRLQEELKQPAAYYNIFLPV